MHRHHASGIRYQASGICFFEFCYVEIYLAFGLCHLEFLHMYPASGIMDLTYGHDYNGNITGITNNNDATKNKTYTYDPLDRLKTAASTGLWGSLEWTYDGVGNRQTQTEAAGTGTYTYQPGTNKLASISGAQTASFTYDPNGNTDTESTTRDFVYNQNQRLIAVVDNSITQGEYVYNGNGQRVKKTVNGIATVFHYDLQGKLIAESDVGGNITAEYVYLNGSPLAKLEGANTYYYHNDHLGTPQKITDASGAVVWEGEFKPFGEAISVTGIITNNLRFPGQYYDSETGLNYNYFRDYNPVIGRYIEADPIGLAGGDVNVYRYVMNNPNSNIDQDGLLCRNKNSANVPMGAWTGTDMPTGEALAALACIEKCVGKGLPWLPFPQDNGTSCSPYDLKITGGSECTPSGTHLPGSTPGSRHCTNQAFDLPPSANNKKLLCCAKKCGVTFILDEESHLHFQTRGGGGPKNMLPDDKDCCPNK